MRKTHLHLILQCHASSAAQTEHLPDQADSLIAAAPASYGTFHSPACSQHRRPSSRHDRLRM